MWVLLLALVVAPVLLVTLGATAIPERWAYSANVVFGLVAVALTLITFWKVERALANYQDRRGDPFAWFGWTLVAYLPIFTTVLAMRRLDPDADFIFGETIMMAAFSFAAPILVHASGRAIDQQGPEISAIFQRWFPHYWALVGAYLLVTLPLHLASDVAWHFMGSNGSTALFGELIAGMLSTLGSVFAVAMTVEAFHRADEFSIS